MKLKKILVIVIIMILFAAFISCSGNKEITETENITTLSGLKANFKQPPVQYQTAPFWVWHDKISKKEIDIQLQDFKAKGIGGVFIHPRYGLITEYLSDEWFELVQYAVEKAKSLDMHAWLYDENPFPSGFAGGHVPAEMPESYNQGQGLELYKFTKLPQNAENYFLILKKQGEEFVQIINPVEQKDKAGDFYLFEKKYYPRSKFYGGFSYVDLLVEGVTEKFIELTMTGYEQSIGHEFGKSVPGIFTDEPNINTYQGKNVMRWTPALFEKFQESWGYDLKSNLPSLFEEVGDWKCVRHNYYQVLLQMFIDRWSKPWYNYTEKNNLIWTGHYWEHGWPDPHHGGDNMAMYAWHQMPGIDLLFNMMGNKSHKYGKNQFGNIRAVKELRSAANQLGRKRTLSETYGAAGWELSFKDMKRLGDWEYVLGVNFMNQHLSYMTLIGDRKHDFPTSFSYHTPWWNYYKPLADHYSRLSLALSSGEQINNTLILEPTTTGWMYYSWGESPERLWEIRELFHNFLEGLEKNHIEYDLGSENIIKDRARIENGKFVVGKRAYNLIVIPEGFENFDAVTFQLLKTYLKQGGRVLSFANIPKYIDGAASNEINEIVNQFKSQWNEAQSIHNSKVSELLSAKDFRMLNTEKISGNLFHQRRQFYDGQLVFLANSSLDESASGRFVIGGATVIEFNTLSGELSNYPTKRNGDQIEVAFELPPAGSLLLFVSDTAMQVDGEQSSQVTNRELKSSGEMHIKRISSNMLTLDYCDLMLGDQMEKGIYFYTAGNKIWQHHGFKEDNPWVNAAQYKTDIIDRDNFDQNSGFEVTFHFAVAADVDKLSLSTVVERPELWKVVINGVEIEALENEWWLDRAFGVFDIGEHVKTGDNRIQLITHPMSIFAELEPVYILGNFNLESADRGWKIVPEHPLTLGKWVEQGLPFYKDGVSYTKTFDLKNDKAIVVKLNDWLGSVARVLVNGQDAGIIGWPPYELKVTDKLIKGQNEISVIVYGSLKNLLGPHHYIDAKTDGFVTPWSFKYAPEKQPAGLDYDLDGYGLFEDFQVFVTE